MDIFELIQDMEQHIILRDWNKLEHQYKEVCSKLAGTGQAQLISSIETSIYMNGLHSGIQSAVDKAIKSKAKAIYFEYDLDNGWSSNYFVCKKYLPRVEEDDNWACDWVDDVEGPDMDEFAAIYGENGFDSSDIAIGSTVYLIARTVACFGRSIDKLLEQTKLYNLAVCIGFHDQDTVFRVIERGNKSIKSMLELFKRAAKKHPPMADSEFQLTVVIEPVYESIGDFVDGLAFAQKGDKYGYINNEDDTIISFKFEEAKNFSDGIAAVKIRDKWGFIDKNGEIVIEPKFDDVQYYTNSYALVKLYDKYGCIDKSGKFLTDPIYDNIAWGSGEGLIAVRLNGKWGYIDENGVLVIPAIYDANRSMLNQPGKFSEGLAYVEYKDKFGYIDKNNNMIIEFTEYDNRYGCRMSDFNEGIATVDYGRYNQHYIDKSGKVVAKGSVCFSFSEGLGRMRLPSDKSVFIDKNGQIVIKEGKQKYNDGTTESEVKIEFAGSIFHEGLSPVIVKSDCWGYIDKSGRLVMKFDYHVGSFHEGIATIAGSDNRRNNKTGYINKEGKLLMKPMFDCTWDISNGMGRVRLDGKHGYVGFKR